jgi:Mn2+/Fe2+ NRAMP family transporter
LAGDLAFLLFSLGIFTDPDTFLFPSFRWNFGPILLILVLKICNDQKIMGSHNNTKWDNLVGYATVFIRGLFSILILWQIIVK